MNLELCDCFAEGSYGVDVTCAFETDCGTVQLSFDDEETISEPDPMEEQANADAMSCLLAAAAAGQPARIRGLWGETTGQYFTEYFVLLFEDGTAASWRHNFEGLIDDFYPVELRGDVAASLADCEAVSDSLDQWDCIDDRATAGEAAAECTELLDHGFD